MSIPGAPAPLGLILSMSAEAAQKTDNSKAGRGKH
jgi:hypothetical protein